MRPIPVHPPQTFVPRGLAAITQATAAVQLQAVPQLMLRAGQEGELRRAAQSAVPAPIAPQAFRATSANLDDVAPQSRRRKAKNWAFEEDMMMLNILQACVLWPEVGERLFVW
jgi:hypothetical protein